MEEKMKKKILRLLLPILALAVLAAGIIGIQAWASEPTPYVLSKNVSYGSRVYLYYAVPVDSVPDGHTVKLGFYSSESDDTANSYILPEEQTQKVYGTTCYVFQSYGVSAKNINTKQYVRPVSFNGEAPAVVGDVVSYSVEDYIYERLYGNGFALIDDGDGKNFDRRNLYYDLLWYGRSAQDLLDKSDPNHIGKPIDYFGALFSVGGVSGNEVTLDFDEAILTGGKTPTFARYYNGTIGYYDMDVFGDAISYVEFSTNRWIVKHYDVFGNVTEEYYVADGGTVTVGADSGVIVARPDLSPRTDLGENLSALTRGSKVHIITNGFVAVKDVRLLLNKLKQVVGSAGAVTVSSIANSADADLTIEFDYFADSDLRANPTTKNNPVKADGTSIFENARYCVSSSGDKITVLCEKNPYTSLNVSSVAVDEFVKLLEPAFGIVGFVNDDEGKIIEDNNVNLIELQAEIDRMEVEARWEALEIKLGDKDIVRELRAFFEGMTNETIVKWSGSLYDPATGLFYSSSSGKNTEGYYPHPEATSQNTSFPMNSGMMRYLGGTIILPQITKYKIIYYLKSIQDPNGDFYVAQMNKATIATERVGRDRGACITMLSRCGGKPTYTNGSTVGDGITAEEYWQSLVDAGLVTEDDKPIIYWHQNNEQAKVAPTASLNSSAVMAVSKVVLASDDGATGEEGSSSGVAQFQTHKAFIEWLLKKDAYNSPYGAISNTSSAATFIDRYSKTTGAYTLEKMQDDWGASAIKSDANGDYVEFYGRADGISNGAGGADKNVTPFKVYEDDKLNVILISWLNSYINDAGLFGKITNNYVSKTGGDYALRNGEYVYVGEGNGSYTPDYDGFYEGWGYQNSNGMLKCIGRYSTLGIAFPEAEKAAVSLLKGICSPEQPSGNILVMYNVWSSLSSLRSNISKYYEPVKDGDMSRQELLDFIDNALYSPTDFRTETPIVNETTGEPMSYGALAIRSNYEKSLLFRKSDGGFAHSISQGTGTWQGGLPVGVPSDNLSDVDGTFCGITSLGSSICGALGINMSSEVPIHMESDYMKWMDSLLKQPYVIKKTPTEREQELIASSKETETFEELTSAQGQSYVASGLTNGNSASVIEKDGDKALFIDKASTQKGVDVRPTVMRSDAGAKIFVFEFDMLVENAPNGISTEIYLRVGSTQAYYILLSGTTTIYAHENGGTGKATTAKIGEWSHFKFVYSEDTASYDVIVNGQFVFTGTALRSVSDAPKVSELTAASIWLGATRALDCYVDNLSVTRVVGTVDFDDGKIPSQVTGSSSATKHTVVDKGDGDMALRVNKDNNTTYGGGLNVSLTEAAEIGANTFIFECDMLVTKFSKMAIYITNPETSTASNFFYTNICSSSANAVTYGTATAPVGEWVHFRLEYCKTKINGDIFGKTVITITRQNGSVASKTYNNTDTIDFDKVNMIMFNCQTATVHDTLYDNIVCKKVYVAANAIN